MKIYKWRLKNIYFENFILNSTCNDKAIWQIEIFSLIKIPFVYNFNLKWRFKSAFEVYFYKVYFWSKIITKENVLAKTDLISYGWQCTHNSSYVLLCKCPWAASVTQALFTAVNVIWLMAVPTLLFMMHYCFSHPNST